MPVRRPRAATAGTPKDPEADMLTCTSCGRQYRVDDGIPVLLLDEAIEAGPEEPDTEEGAAG